MVKHENLEQVKQCDTEQDEHGSTKYFQLRRNGYPQKCLGGSTIFGE